MNERNWRLDQASIRHFYPGADVGAMTVREYQSLLKCMGRIKRHELGIEDSADDLLDDLQDNE